MWNEDVRMYVGKSAPSSGCDWEGGAGDDAAGPAKGMHRPSVDRPAIDRQPPSVPLSAVLAQRKQPLAAPRPTAVLFHAVVAPTTGTSTSDRHILLSTSVPQKSLLVTYLQLHRQYGVSRWSAIIHGALYFVTGLFQGSRTV
jgi:hypothetical protein